MKKPAIETCKISILQGRELTYCSRNCEEFYPYYGKAPHKSFNVIDGKINTNKILSGTLPIEKWKDEHFLPEIHEGEDLNKIPSVCGEYYCPACRNGQGKKIDDFYKNL